VDEIQVAHSSEDVMGPLVIVVGEESELPLVDQDDDFDSLDSEEDGLASDELESWGLTGAFAETPRLSAHSIEHMGTPSTLSLEDCLKV
jgi:hypothetical protein